MNSPSTLAGFKGDFGFVVKNEYRGRPYVPSERSGVTIDIGIDLAFSPPQRIYDIYGDYLSNDQQLACIRCRGIIGRDAEIVLNQDLFLQSIEIPLEIAMEKFPEIADPVWQSICRRWPRIREASEGVHTAILDLVWDRGILNKHLHCLDVPMRRANWQIVGENLLGMQQRHKQEEIRERRRRAAELILGKRSNGSVTKQVKVS